MRKEHLAARLHGRKRGEEMSKEEESEAMGYGLLVCYAYSDDNLEFRGLIDDEFGACEGGKVFIHKNKKGELKAISEETLDEITTLLEEHDIPFTLPVAQIEAVWEPEGKKQAWDIITAIPHVDFHIMDEDDGTLWCVGIVMEEEDIRKTLK